MMSKPSKRYAYCENENNQNIIFPQIVIVSELNMIQVWR